MAGRRDAVRKKTFTYEQAVALLPEVQRITAAAVAAVEQLEAEGEADDERPEIHDRYHAIVGKWASEIIEKGIEVKGLWLIDFDCGSGYYCWKYPEPGLQFFHDYDSGFGARVELN